jgi:hypothetical protein
MQNGRLQYFTGNLIQAPLDGVADSLQSMIAIS